MKLYGAIGAEDKGSYKKFKPFDIKHLGPGWDYKELERYHKLKSDGKRWRAFVTTCISEPFFVFFVTFMNVM
ncbi:hypothetical protein Hanom_Chr01g00050061 [Helianthus anomalus]